MKNIVTRDWLDKNNACQEAAEKFSEVFGKSGILKDIINFTIREKNNQYLQWANWLIVRKMNHNQQIKYAIYAAEQILYIFEQKYPDDDRPRNAIEAAKKHLIIKNKKLVNAAYAAYAAHAAYAAYAAAHAAYAAYAAHAAHADNVMRIKTLNYGLKIIYGGKLCLE